MKYVVFQCKTQGRPTLHIGVQFPEVLTHKDVAEAIEQVKVMPAGPFTSWWCWPKAVSAGFMTSDGHCHGDSESLKLRAHSDDTAILKDGRGIGFKEREVPNG